MYPVRGIIKTKGEKTMEISYQMNKKQFNSILSTRKGADEKKNPYQYVMEIINTFYGLQGTVTHLSIVD